MDRVNSFEFPAANMKRAQKFMNSVFGWKFKNWDKDYAHIELSKMDKDWVPKERGVINGGMYIRDSAKEYPMLVITVKSIDKSIEKVKKAKGKVLIGKTAADEWGFWALIKDTEGNVLELWQDA